MKHWHKKEKTIALNMAISSTNEGGKINFNFVADLFAR